MLAWFAAKVKSVPNDMPSFWCVSGVRRRGREGVGLHTKNATKT